MKRLVFCLVLSACGAPVPAPPPAQIPAGGADTCEAGQIAPLVGQDATALEKVLILRPVRLIRPGTIVTQDFRPDRLNIDIGADNRIGGAHCG